MKRRRPFRVSYGELSKENMSLKKELTNEKRDKILYRNFSILVGVLSWAAVAAVLIADKQ